MHSLNTSFKFGAIRVNYFPSENAADLHVDKPDQAQKKQLWFHLYQAVNQVKEVLREDCMDDRLAPAKLEMHPTGAAVIKGLVESLSEGLGKPEMVTEARKLKEMRKDDTSAQEAQDSEIITTEVIDEHIAYLKALKGIVGISISPILPQEDMKERMLYLSILENTPEATNFLSKYEEVLRAKKKVSLTVKLSYMNIEKWCNYLKKSYSK